MWFSATVAYLLQGLSSCVFRDGILHSEVTIEVTSIFLLPHSDGVWM